MSAFFERVRAALAPKGYDVLRELATGGMGTVFLARQRALNRLVAIKIIRPELYTAQAAERFRNEATTLASFSHPNIVPIHDHDEADGMPYYVMDFLEGETVADRLREGAMAPADALKLGRDLLDALGAAHAHGVVHRDVKPSNVFLVDGRAVLVDFGVAKQRAASGRGSGDAESPVTAPGTVVGTVDYMPPEQARGAEVTERTDLYAAGMVIYEAFTGRHWFEALRDGSQRLWWHVPGRIARVLQRALQATPGDRWPDATSFRRALWHTREWTYQRRTIWLTIAGLVAGASAALWLLHRWQQGLAPFRLPAALQVVVVPFEATCAVAAGISDRVAAALVGDLQGYLDFSARGPTRPPWFVTRSTIVVRGTACARRDSLRVELQTEVGLAGADATPLAARGDTGHLDVLAGMLAYGVVRDIWNRENPLDPVLPLAALPKTGQGLAAWLAAEQLLAQGRWGDADHAYDEAEALDSTCWLCAWRHADVDKWLGRRFDEGRAARYLGHIDSFPPHYQNLIRASRQPLVQRLETLIRVTRQRRDFLPAYFMLADELYHRGPLVGHPREEAIEAFERVVHLRPDFVPAWEHLTWVLAADGQESAAKAAYDTLQASGAPRDPFSQELRAMLWVGLRCRFDGFAACRRALDAALPQAGAYPDLAAGPRYLMTFDAPRGAIEFGRRLAASRDQPAFARSGLIGEVSGYLALGLVDSARAAARELRERFRRPELDVFPAELEGALLLLDPDSLDAGARWAEVHRLLAQHVQSRASTAATRRRAAWMLLLLGRRRGGLPDSAEYALLLGGEPGRRPLASLLDADDVARQGRTTLALTLTDSLTALSADNLGEPATVDPFFRTVLHLLRAAWHERRQDIASAANELAWHENNDAMGRPSGPPQVADMDWGFGSLARWRLAGLLDRAGEAGACRPYRQVAGSWMQGDARYRSRADSAGRRFQALKCGAG